MTQPPADDGQPAGYFSTFSILDPSDGSSQTRPRSQKRNRRVFVCLPCHKRKLKCDKHSPCGRCKANGIPDECIYQPFPSLSKTKPASSIRLEFGGQPLPIRPAVEAGYSAVTQTSDARDSVHGTTHWSKVASGILEGEPYLNGSEPLWKERYHQIKNLKYLFPGTESHKFPFGTPNTYTLSKAEILQGLPTRHICELLISNYMIAVETTHRMLSPGRFRKEFHAFWRCREQVSDGWLAQLLMMFALGTRATPAYLFEGTGRSAVEWMEWSLDAAQLCFGRSPYMATPDITTVRTLCMMAIAKMAEIRSTKPNQLVVFMGFVRWTAMSLQLHRSPNLNPGMSHFDAEMRRRLWATIRLLDLDIAMRGGTADIVEEHDAGPPRNVDEANFASIGGGGNDSEQQGYTDGFFQKKLTEIVQSMVEVVNRVNSHTSAPLDYDGVLAWDTRIRNKHQDIESILALEKESSSRQALKAAVQSQFLDVMVHRTLLALHHAFACAADPDGKLYKKSRMVALESSIAIIETQQRWIWPPGPSSMDSDCSAMTESACSSPAAGATDIITSNDLLVDLCHDDVAVAMMYILLATRADGLRPGEEHGTPEHIRLFETACAMVHQTQALLRDRACLSAEHFKEYFGLSILMYVVRCNRWGQPVLPMMLELANEVEHTMVLGKHDMIIPQEGLGFTDASSSQLIETPFEMALDQQLFGTEL